MTDRTGQDRTETEVQTCVRKTTVLRRLQALCAPTLCGPPLGMEALSPAEETSGRVIAGGSTLGLPAE